MPVTMYVPHQSFVGGNGGGDRRMEGAYDIPIANKLLLHYPQAMTHFWAMDERATCHKAE